ncbi:MAG: phytanoyl-CoA dioxygenase family protein [Candidatus Glassbacteria bacterium]
MPKLSGAEVLQYRQDGYYIFGKPLFPAGKFQRLKVIFEELLEARGPDDLDVPHFAEPRLLEFLLDEGVLDLVECILGPDFGLWSSHFISKTAQTGKKTPWHEDSAYWEGRFDRYDNIVTIWLAIDPATRENGCMRVVPGSHLQGGFSQYEQMEVPTDRIFTREIPRVDESRAVYLELEPNHCSLHDCRIIHGARANTSDTRRTGYTMRYFSQHQKLNSSHPHNLNHRIWHCRGNNLHGNPVVN